MTIRATLWPEAARFSDDTTSLGFPQLGRASGPIGGPAHMKLLFDDAKDEEATWPLSAEDYAAGDLTAKVHWYAENATSGTCIWRIRLATITPETDSASVEAKSYSSTITSVTTTHLGTTSKRPHTSDFTISSSAARDLMAAGDIAWLGLTRLTSDTMSNDAALERIEVTESA